MAKATQGQGGRQGDKAAPAAQPQERQERKPPAKEWRDGRIKVVAWANESKDHGTWYSFSIGRSYKDQNQQWKTAGTLGADDLLVAALLLQEARRWVAQQKSGSTTGDTSGGETSGSNGGSDVPF